MSPNSQIPDTAKIIFSELAVNDGLLHFRPYFKNVKFHLKKVYSTSDGSPKTEVYKPKTEIIFGLKTEPNRNRKLGNRTEPKTEKSVTVDALYYVLFSVTWPVTLTLGH